MSIGHCTDNIIDIKAKCGVEQIAQTVLVENIGTSPSYVNRLIKKPEKLSPIFYKDDGAVRI